MSDEEVRPRRGTITRHDGTVVEIKFEPEPDDPKSFIAVGMDDGPVEFTPGRDQLWVDVIGPGQAVGIGVPGDA
ncbi:hypothetical protein [Actinomadura violacea]|uniref:Uncharacterized protein n=1 Tax=Actinomadura violacea TaxID=2819934 RepID=A0ABS3RY36_9ACTN|nr:hypothetical protein [Actinomadura violacea]MBO2461556.1 hypothetical protein [Actinomadura violacea]